ncbi:sensor histidine kinase [Thermotalea metallivorans]|uniref:histidine kinase n=1 Tax=Thermotalea metallivorans TaxID=520762 RepID=A0A140L900_9FIRM|nr:ATP-binding protein [Thermotalea metallivorans]KXG77025.1 Alkaline phosphatase synthesis sensor protein PhoR [Thermotalea metallivorans]
MLLINSFISEAIRINYINQKKIHLFTQGNIIAGRVINVIEDRIVESSGLEEITKEISKDIKARVLIVNKMGFVVSDSYDVLKGSPIRHYELQESLKGKAVAKQHNLEKYGRTMYVSVPIILNTKVIGAVFISASLEEIYQNIHDIMRNFLYLSLISILITGFISFVFAKLISTPIEKLTDSIMKIHQGNLDERVEIRGNDELSNLGSAFNLMITKLAQVEQQRKDFVANVSHELRTPLSAIKLLAESLLHQEDVKAETYREFLQDIDTEVDRLNKIIENLLALVDIDKGKLELDYQITYVNYLIENVIHSLKPLADNKQIEMVFYEREKIHIKLDQIKIQQALTNIIHNAIKYTPNGGKIEISLYPEYEDVVIKIEDNGIGIPEESLPYIFERFYRVDKARARSTGGTGLGLAISQQIVVLHQGKIEVASEVNKGTVFYVRLPKEVRVPN